MNKETRCKESSGVGPLAKKQAAEGEPQKETATLKGKDRKTKESSGVGPPAKGQAPVQGRCNCYPHEQERERDVEAASSPSVRHSPRPFVSLVEDDQVLERSLQEQEQQNLDVAYCEQNPYSSFKIV